MDGFFAPVLCCAGAFVVSLAPVIAWNKEDKTVIVVWFTGFIAIAVFMFILSPLMILLTELLHEQLGIWSFLIVLLVSTTIVTAVTGTLSKSFK